MPKLTQTIVWEPQPGPQTHLLTCPDNIKEIFFGGARGGGKSDAVLGEWASHAATYGEEAIGICFRRERVQLTELIERAKTIYRPLGVTYHEQDKYFKFPNGARLKLAYIENDSDASNYQGHAYTRVYCEEITTFPNPEPIMKLMATLDRNPRVPSKFIATGNPGGVGHSWVKARYVDPHPKGMRIIQSEFVNPFNKEKIVKNRIFIPSKVTDNKYTNTNEYIGNLHLSGNEELVKAWLHGEWDVLQGAFFPEFSHEKHVIRTFVPPRHWTRFQAMDWGSSTPFSIGWYCVVPDEYDANLEINNRHWAMFNAQRGEILPKGAIIKYREYYGSKWRENIEKNLPNADSANPNVGLKLTASEVALQIRLREAKEPKGIDGRPRIMYRVADPKIFSSDNGPSIAEIMARPPHYINWSRADNKRVQRGGAMSGWDALRARLKGEDGRPLIYFMDCCLDTIRTLPMLQHDPKRMEDAETHGEDHAPDETRYACMSRPYSRTGIDDTARNYIKTRDNSVYLDDEITHVERSIPFNHARIH